MIPFKNNFVPEISHFEIKDHYTVFYTVTGRSGVIFLFPGLDLEAKDSEARSKSIFDLMRDLPVWCEARWIVNAQNEFDSHLPYSRKIAINDLGYLSKRTYLALEWDTQASASRVLRSNKKLDELNLSQIIALGGECLREGQITGFFFGKLKTKVGTLSHGLDFGDHVTGLVRIYQPGTSLMSQETLAKLMEEIPLPYSAQLHCRKISKEKADLQVRAKKNQSHLIEDAVTSEKEAALDHIIKEISLQGASLFEMEWLLILKRDSERGRLQLS